MSRKKKPYDRQVFQAITLIMQFGINMLVPICLMSAAGIWLDKHFGTDFWMILLFCMGAVAGGQNVYRMARTIYEDGDDKHTKKDKENGSGDGAGYLVPGSVSADHRSIYCKG